MLNVFAVIKSNNKTINNVITSYSIHYTKLYDKYPETASDVQKKKREH